MAIDDIVFSDGDSQNYIVEVPIETLQSPVDILSEDDSNASALCFEAATESTVSTSPEILFLSDGKVAKRITDTFYLKLP